jgi:hypothetical protein
MFLLPVRRRRRRRKENQCFTVYLSIERERRLPGGDGSRPLYMKPEPLSFFYFILFYFYFFSLSLSLLYSIIALSIDGDDVFDGSRVYVAAHIGKAPQRGHHHQSE